ncbi:MAG: YidC/Oxa1 family membrane protein insertase [Patescibacteria group bacterium]
MYTIYQEILFRPIFNALIFLYSLTFQDLGIAIIFLTIGVRALLVPLFQRALMAQKKMTEIQPEIKKIQDECKDNKEEQARRLMELYKNKGANPFSGCLPILVQLPVFITLYNVFIKLFDSAQLELLYPFIARPEILNPIAFGILNLALPNIFMAFFAGVSQYFQAVTMPEPPKLQQSNPNAPDMGKILSFQMKYFFPVLIFFISLQLSASMALYWTVLNVFGIVQQKLAARN